MRLSRSTSTPMSSSSPGRRRRRGRRGRRWVGRRRSSRGGRRRERLLVRQRDRWRHRHRVRGRRRTRRGLGRQRARRLEAVRRRNAVVAVAAVAIATGEDDERDDAQDQHCGARGDGDDRARLRPPGSGRRLVLGLVLPLPPGWDAAGTSAGSVHLWLVGRRVRVVPAGTRPGVGAAVHHLGRVALVEGQRRGCSARRRGRWRVTRRRSFPQAVVALSRVLVTGVAHWPAILRTSPGPILGVP